MMTDPDNFIPQFAAAGANYITVHQEACIHLDRTIQLIRAEGCIPGVSINPSTPVNTLASVISLVDMVLIMTVNPGFGGQSFLFYTLDKIRKLKTLYLEAGKEGLIEVDGGINSQTTPQVVKAGANVLVAGAAIFEQDNIGEACREIKSLAENALSKDI
jgi:ribulose-phosphate 3-epimerase